MARVGCGIMAIMLLVDIARQIHAGTGVNIRYIINLGLLAFFLSVVFEKKSSV
jgi:hypothetical protein